MVKKSKPSRYDIKGVRWNDSYGNTYHKTRVTAYDKKGETLYTEASNLNYGYGDTYRQTGADMIFKGKTSSENYNKLRNEKVTYDVKDVNRKKDMFI